MFSFGRKREIPLKKNWLDSLKKDISEAQLKYKEPWKQAGFAWGREEWEICRKPIAECITKPGAFLDIECSNGYLLESVLKWTSHSITPFGIDLSARLIDVAKQRLPDFSDNFFVGNANTWTTTGKFDYVRTELGYVLEESQEQYLQKLLGSLVAEDGVIILTEYRSQKDSNRNPWINDKINMWDLNVIEQKSAFLEGTEVTRVLVIAHHT
ncbi:MAG: class I SAM-dependent methyltransferase [Dehalococcoidales bacterium]|nr:class I SAM-dependent methyltransferase [Dehalococcoidales bacterium]